MVLFLAMLKQSFFIIESFNIIELNEFSYLENNPKSIISSNIEIKSSYIEIKFLFSHLIFNLKKLIAISQIFLNLY